MAKRISRWTMFNPNRLTLDFSTQERAAIELLAAERKMQPADLAHAFIVERLEAEGHVATTAKPAAPQSDVSDADIKRRFGSRT